MKLLKQKAISFLISFIILSIMVLVYTFLLYNGKISSDAKAIRRSTFIIGAFYFFILGFVSGLIEKKRGFISSLITGLALIVLIILIKLLSKQVIFVIDWLKYLVYLGCIIFGGILGVNVRAPKKKESKHH